MPGNPASVREENPFFYSLKLFRCSQLRILSAKSFGYGWFGICSAYFSIGLSMKHNNQQKQ
jgi:hypothetical protein